ncbi:2'-5' RNA ligase family protein [Microvirga sp. 2YAF29]|uniref:2'-5' RNA ligase family protein n=1 Tax=Microvirga sp. 2YAF29 TaxID=3233031 RepID=UPI003F998402
MADAAPLILTLALDERSFAFFDEQRRRYFPPARNFIPAHLTLFHHLPGAHPGKIEDTVETTIAARNSFSLSVTGLRSLGRGVAYSLQSQELAELRRDLAAEWAQWLTPQDRQKHQPHVTIQNNVEPVAARALLTTLSEPFEPFSVVGTGLDLWWYRGGPWEKVREFRFANGQ